MKMSVSSFESKSKVFASGLRIFLILLISVTGLFLPEVQAQEVYHPQRLMIQFSEQSGLNKQLTEVFQDRTIESFVPSTYPEIDSEDPAFRHGDNTFLHYIFEFFNSYPVQSVRPLIKSTERSALSSAFDRVYLVYISEDSDVTGTLENLLQNQFIEVAEPDYIGFGGGKLVSMGEFETTMLLPKTNPPVNDVHFNFQYGLLNTGQSIGGILGIAGADINIVPGWSLTTGNSEIVLGVLDSGMPLEHHEFEGRVFQGFNFVSNNNNYFDDHGHGASVTSIAAATGNNSGLMAGTDWQSTILPVKILDNNNSGLYSWWINGINYAVENGAHVINMSVGGSSQSTFLQNAVNSALENGVIVVACMMNENNDVTYYPAGYEGVISVGATNNKDERAEPFAWGGGSNYGNHIDFAAPGDNIASLSGNNFQSIGYWSGTSMSAPFVAATITLMLSIDPNLTRDEIYSILKETTRDRVHGNKDKTQEWEQFTGWGRIDVTAALELTLAGTFPSSVDSNQGSFQNKYGFIFPNPASDQVSVITSNEIHTIEIIDTSGRLLISIPSQQQGSKSYIDISKLSNGIYLIRYKGKNIVQTQKLIVKNH
ncbi:MAG: T9SS C-terminal target domain-containing protein [Bacteroidetes bacterium]|nr:MAG: T9SS C-terminal target domain-containing protein [Bacteroidota bacterium]